MKYAIGTPGHKARIYIDVADSKVAAAQLQSGEIMTAVSAAIMNATVNSDGSMTAPAPAPAPAVQLTAGGSITASVPA